MCGWRARAHGLIAARGPGRARGRRQHDGRPADSGRRGDLQLARHGQRAARCELRGRAAPECAGAIAGGGGPAGCLGSHVHWHLEHGPTLRPIAHLVTNADLRRGSQFRPDGGREPPARVSRPGSERTHFFPGGDWYGADDDQPEQPAGAGGEPHRGLDPRGVWWCSPSLRRGGRRVYHPQQREFG